jgi:hypothetical protein
MENSALTGTPLDANIKLQKETERMEDVLYGKAIGSLMYTAIGTQPDISYSVMALSQYSNQPGPMHWSAIKCMFHYLRGTINHGITLGGRNTKVIL